jgi:hypothetical protein
METERRIGFVEKYFGHESRFLNLLFKGVILFVIAQQIYYPQELKYFHLALIGMYIIFLEFFKGDQRAFYDEYVFNVLILGCSIISIADYFTLYSLGIPYLVLLLISIAYGFKLVFRIYSNVSKKDFSQFTSKNRELLEKSTTFTRVLMTMVMLLLAVSFLYGVYKIITIY